MQVGDQGSECMFYARSLECLANCYQQVGYVRVSWGGMGGHDLIGVHTLALWAEGRYADDESALEGSHLCGRPACFNVLHLEFEGHQRNLDRRNCVVWVTVPPCEACGKAQLRKVCVCKHGAEGARLCIKYCAGFADPAEFESSGLYIPLK